MQPEVKPCRRKVNYLSPFKPFKFLSFSFLNNISSRRICHVSQSAGGRSPAVRLRWWWGRRRCGRGEKGHHEEWETREEGCGEVREFWQKVDRPRPDQTFRFRGRRQNGWHGEAAGPRRIGKLWGYRDPSRRRGSKKRRAQIPRREPQRLGDSRGAR